MFVSLARNYAKSGYLMPSRENLEHARSALEAAKRTFERITGLSEADGKTIEDRIRALGSEIDLLST